MKIIVGGNVVKMLSKFVSYMRIDAGYNYDTLMKLKSKMLKFVQSHIKKDILNNGAYTSRSYACWWTDGKSGKALVFDYTILPHQELVLIYKMRYESMENIIESNESVRDVRSLIERMNVRNNKKIHYTTICENYSSIGSHFFKTNNGNTELKSIVTLQSNTSGQCCHIVEDDHCYVLYDGNDLNDNNCQLIHHIFPEAFNVLKDLPQLLPH